jgi:hypothetical protein
MTKDAKVIEDWINIINEEGKNLSKWELDFMESISDQFSVKNWISDRQEEILERIYSEKTPN